MLIGKCRSSTMLYRAIIIIIIIIIVIIIIKIIITIKIIIIFIIIYSYIFIIIAIISLDENTADTKCQLISRTLSRMQHEVVRLSHRCPVSCFLSILEHLFFLLFQVFSL